MLWHMIRFDCSELSDADRAEVLGFFQAFDSLPHTSAVRFGDDPERAGWVTLLVLFNEQAELALYRAHPIHVEFVKLAARLKLRSAGVDLLTDAFPG
jgi:Stress responsive A/B Barrel Domain